ncbi:uncharacterized protein [Musca autumnalis]|uniref:uncharacterized protein n=1 Tax=Musca autumnalis TaxID=221902 RepID=UPI003CF48134
MSSHADQRHAYQRIFMVVLILLAVFGENVNAVEGNTIKKCAEINEYCQNHWDCCSNSCLSYLYRCVRSYNVYPYPFLGVTVIPTVTLEDIIAQNFGPRNVKPPAPAVAPVPAYRVPTFESRFNGDENAIPNNDEGNDVKVDIVLQGEQQPVLETTTTSAATTQRVEEPCKEIGSKCYSDSECCSQRCHGFLHQCVT